MGQLGHCSEKFHQISAYNKFFPGHYLIALVNIVNTLLFYVFTINSIVKDFDKM